MTKYLIPCSCPQLDEDGKCMIWHNRPIPCREAYETEWGLKNFYMHPRCAYGNDTDKHESCMECDGICCKFFVIDYPEDNPEQKHYMLVRGCKVVPGTDNAAAPGF